MESFTGYPQPEQLAAVQPLQDAPADLEVVSPPFPLLTNPQADMSRAIFLLRQAGQRSGASWPMTRYSNRRSHAVHRYS